jgi:Matrixin
MKPGEKIFCGLLAVLVLCILPAAAASALSAVTTDPGGRPSVITEYGTGRDFGLVKVTHIDYARPAEKVRPAKAANCFKLAGWRWPGSVTYTIDSSTGSPLSAAVAGASGVWDAQTSRSLFTAVAYGDHPFDSRDAVNSISFGDYADGDVIAVTMTWYYPSTKNAIESDILFDTNYTWGTVDSQTPSVMDLRNIATHEIGHTLGLSDLYTAPCSAATMFGLADYGETIKRDLTPSDITGLRKIYGL